MKNSIMISAFAVVALLGAYLALPAAVAGPAIDATAPDPRD